VDPVGQRLGESARAGLDAIGQRVDVVLRGEDVLGEAAGGVYADEPAVRAEVGVPSTAQAARAVPVERVHRHLAPDEVRIYTLSDLDHGPGELVAHNQRRGAVAHLAKVALDL
jgi:hypothetical protein